MIEAIGHEHFGESFRRCAARHVPGGTMPLQSITIAEEHCARARDEVDFVKRDIVPGCCIPSTGALGVVQMLLVRDAGNGPSYRYSG